VTRADRASDTPVASPSSPSPLARSRCFLQSRQDRPWTARVNERSERTIRGAFHRSKTFARERLFGRPARDPPGAAVLPPRRRPSTPLERRDSPCGEIAPPGLPSTRPFASGVSRFSEPWCRSSTSATDSTREHTLSSRRSSHASEAFAPLLAGTNRCRLRRSTRTLPPRRPASRDPRAPAFAVVLLLGPCG